MLSLEEWLSKVGFIRGNPFARKQADEETDVLQTYFVEHPAYSALRERELTRSVILAAPRGFGKSTARWMFEAFCADRGERLRALIIRLMDWSWAVETQRAGLITWRDYLGEICRRTLQALAQQIDSDWSAHLANLDRASYLRWLCTNHAHYLRPSQRQQLMQLVTAAADLDDTYASYPLSDHLSCLVDLLRGLGFDTGYVLVDRIDELEQTTADHEVGANLLVPLVANLPFLETPGLVWRCFIPLEIVRVLEQRDLLRKDRVTVVELSWAGHDGRTRLLDLLRQRLLYYSENQISSLGVLAERPLRDLDERLVDAADASPRHLLNLGDLLLHCCARTATDNDLNISQRHLATVLGTTDRLASAGFALDEGIPPLRLLVDGRIMRGDQLVENWRELPTLQRKLLDYLYSRRGELCLKEEIIAAVWTHEEVSDEGSLRKLAARLINFIEPDPEHPVYIEKIRGGHYSLKNVQ